MEMHVVDVQHGLDKPFEFVRLFFGGLFVIIETVSYDRPLMGDVGVHAGWSRPSTLGCPSAIAIILMP